MYQSSIRDKKKHQKFNNVKVDNYVLDAECEEYAFVNRLLGNCRVSLLTNSGNETIGIIRGSMRKFNKRVLIEAGDVVVVSKRDFQDSKVDIVHKYNIDQVQQLIKEGKLSNIIANSFNFKGAESKDNAEDSYISFEDISTDSD